MMVRDEVCGMEFAPDEAATTLVFQGTRYYFCAERCRERFREHPDWYVPGTMSPGEIQRNTGNNA